MKDDPREVDWAPKKIKALERKVMALKAVIGPENAEDEELETTLIDWLIELQDRVTALEGMTTTTISALRNRVVAVEGMNQKLERAIAFRLDKSDRGVGQRISQLEKAHSDRLSGLKNQIDGLNKADARKGDRLLQLEDQFRSHIKWASTSGGEWTDPEGPVIGSTERSAQMEFPIQELSPESLKVVTKGRKYQPDLDDELDGIPDVHGRHTPRPGGVVPPPQAEILNGAAKRVIELMSSLRYGQPWIDLMVKAVLGQDVIHEHGQHSMHNHSWAEYQNHQKPIDNERLLGHERAPN